MSLRRQLLLLLAFCMAACSFVNEVESKSYAFSRLITSFLLKNLELARSSVGDQAKLGIIFDDDAVMAVTGFKHGEGESFAKIKERNATAVFQIAQSALVPALVERNWSEGDVLAFLLLGESVDKFCELNGMEVKKSFDNQVLILGKEK
mgnify:CR=1 FL=1